jgi:hypothetical protein
MGVRKRAALAIASICALASLGVTRAKSSMRGDSLRWGPMETSNSELASRVAETAQAGFEQGATVLSKEKVEIYSARCLRF